MAASSSAEATKVSPAASKSEADLDFADNVAGAGLEISHTETGEPVHSVKTVGPSPVVAWAPMKYCLAYSDIGSLRIIGVDTDRK